MRQTERVGRARCKARLQRRRIAQRKQVPSQQVATSHLRLLPRLAMRLHVQVTPDGLWLPAVQAMRMIDRRTKHKTSWSIKRLSPTVLRSSTPVDPDYLCKPTSRRSQRLKNRGCRCRCSSRRCWCSQPGTGCRRLPLHRCRCWQDRLVTLASFVRSREGAVPRVVSRWRKFHPMHPDYVLVQLSVNPLPDVE